MLIIKKNGSKEEFNREKLKISIINASFDAKTPMTEGDANMIVKGIEHEILSIRKDNTSSYEVFALTIEILKKYRFLSVVREYLKYSLE